MIQTTLFNYFTCNSKKVEQGYRYKPSSLRKQTNLTQYFKTIPKKKNLILDYFKPKAKEKKKPFDLILIDIENTVKNSSISCVKKNMYDEDLKYITISYRWGEVQEQYVETPDYIAHITSFYLATLVKLCYHIINEPDLKNIPYLWIDTISVDQQNHTRKKDTILKMNQIYIKASYILAVPDLYYFYLRRNRANRERIELIQEYKDIIYHSVSAVSKSTTNHSAINILKNNINVNNDELKKAYQFLAYIIDDWSNRAWVISEYQIAKEKYTQCGTPLKYTFMSLLSTDDESLLHWPFFSYNFFDQHNNIDIIINYEGVVDNNTFINFLDSRFIQRNHLNMILNSNASRNEDRFYAILPSWNKYQHLIKNKNTISNWNITNMISVKLKLYEILDDDGDLWDKARLLFSCRIYQDKPIIPTFATFHNLYFTIGEIDDIDGDLNFAMHYFSGFKDATTYIKHCKKEEKTIYQPNLIDIQYNKQHCYLTVKADHYFIFGKQPSSIFNQEYLSSYSLKDSDDLKIIHIPYFIYNIPTFNNYIPIDGSYPALSGTLLIGNMNLNRWVVCGKANYKDFGSRSLYPINGYIFNIY